MVGFAFDLGGVALRVGVGGEEDVRVLCRDSQMVVFVQFGEGLNACGDGVGFDHVHRGNTIGRVPMELAPDKRVQHGRVRARNGAAVGHQ